MKNLGPGTQSGLKNIKGLYLNGLDALNAPTRIGLCLHQGVLTHRDKDKLVVHNPINVEEDNKHSCPGTPSRGFHCKDCSLGCCHRPNSLVMTLDISFTKILMFAL